MSTDAFEVVFLRHGESEWNNENLFCGWVDVDLRSVYANKLNMQWKMLNVITLGQRQTDNIIRMIKITGFIYTVVYNKYGHIKWLMT